MFSLICPISMLSKQVSRIVFSNIHQNTNQLSTYLMFELGRRGGVNCKKTISTSLSLLVCT